MTVPASKTSTESTPLLRSTDLCKSNRRLFIGSNNEFDDAQRSTSTYINIGQPALASTCSITGSRHPPVLHPPSETGHHSRLPDHPLRPSTSPSHQTKHAFPSLFSSKRYPRRVPPPINSPRASSRFEAARLSSEIPRPPPQGIGRSWIDVQLIL